MSVDTAKTIQRKTSNVAISGHPLATSIPDPCDRTVNDPAVLVESKYVRQFYFNSTNIGDKASEDQVMNTYLAAATSHGWNATPLGSGVLLQAAVSVATGPALEFVSPSS